MQMCILRITTGMPIFVRGFAAAAAVPTGQRWQQADVVARKGGNV